MLDGRENDSAGSSNDGFYESKREWMGRRHFTLALEGYVVLNDQDIYCLAIYVRYKLALLSKSPFHQWGEGIIKVGTVSKRYKSDNTITREDL
jgi:hypothetical protein